MCNGAITSRSHTTVFQRRNVGKRENRGLLPAPTPLMSLLTHSSSLPFTSHWSELLHWSTLAPPLAEGKRTFACRRSMTQLWKWYSAAWTVRVLLAMNGACHILLHYTLCGHWSIWAGSGYEFRQNSHIHLHWPEKEAKTGRNLKVTSLGLLGHAREKQFNPLLL